VDGRRVDQENRIAKGHRLRIEVGEQVPEEWMGDDPLYQYVGNKGDAVGRSLWHESHGRLDLKCQRLPELPSDMYFLVATVVIRKGRGDFELAAAAHHHELGGFRLADGPLLNLR
jgi:hypothetical protein